MQINDVQKGTYRNRDRDRERPRQKTKMFTQLNWLHLTWIYREKKIISTKKLIYSKQQHLIKIQRLTFYTLSRVHQQTLRHWNCRTKGNTQQIKWVQIKTIRPIFLFSFDYTFFVCSLSQLFLLVQSLLSYLIVSPFSSSPLICNFQLIRVSLVVFGILFWNNVLQLADRNFNMFFFFFLCVRFAVCQKTEMVRFADTAVAAHNETFAAEKNRLSFGQRWCIQFTRNHNDCRSN